MTTTLNAVSGTGLVQTSDGSGVVKVQSNGVTTNALAWVEFAGSSGTINASYNVSSITRNAAGDYTVNFTSATTNIYYVPFASCSPNSSLPARLLPVMYTNAGGITTIAPTTSAFRFSCYNYPNAGTTYDPDYVMAGVFGN